MPHYQPIGTLHSCFKEKFGAPRQSGMIQEARGVLKLNPDPGFRDALNHLEDFTHVWIIFEFHHHLKKGWRPTIRPPRLDAPRRVGVFASRSPHRPNPIGMSVVKLERIDLNAPGGIELHLSGLDILDGTPVLDIKPYLRYADSIETAKGGWTEGDAERYPVEFEAQALQKVEDFCIKKEPGFKKLLTQILELDPRPMSQKRALPVDKEESEGACYGFRIYDFDVKWKISEGRILVTDLILLQDSSTPAPDSPF